MSTPSKILYPNLRHKAQLAEWESTGKYPAWVTGKILKDMRAGAGLSRIVEHSRWLLSPELKRIPRRSRVSFLREQISAHEHILVSMVDLMTRRETFDKMKNEFFPLWDCKKCYCCGTFACVRHHVTPLKHGGSNKPSNVVPLCEPCHAKIHPHLAR